MTLQRKDAEYWLGNLSEGDVRLLIDALGYYKLVVDEYISDDGTEFSKEERKKQREASKMQRKLLEPFAKGELGR